MPLRTDAFLHRETLHTDAWFTQRRFYKENLLRTDAFTHRNFCAERLLHKETYTQSRIGAQKKYTEKLLHGAAFTRFKIAVLPQLLIFDHHFLRKGH
jgi:hypothetical protein